MAHTDKRLKLHKLNKRVYVVNATKFHKKQLEEKGIKMNYDPEKRTFWFGFTNKKYNDAQDYIDFINDYRENKQKKIKSSVVLPIPPKVIMGDKSLREEIKKKGAIFSQEDKKWYGSEELKKWIEELLQERILSLVQIQYQFSTNIPQQSLKNCIFENTRNIIKYKTKEGEWFFYMSSPEEKEKIIQKIKEQIEREEARSERRSSSKDQKIKEQNECKETSSENLERTFKKNRVYDRFSSGKQNFQIGETIFNKNAERKGEPYYLTCIKVKGVEYIYDGYTFGYPFEEGVIFSGIFREATEEEAKPLQEKHERKERQKEARKRLKQIGEFIQDNNELPEQEELWKGEEEFAFLDKNFLAYGGGSWFAIDANYLLFIRNNGSDGADWGSNNYKTQGAGAIAYGVRREHHRELEKEVRTLAVDLSS